MPLPPELLDPRMALYWLSVPLQAALAVTTLALAPGDARHRTFAVLVASNAAWDLAEGLAFASDGAAAAAYRRAGDHFAVWTALALASFLAVYPARRAWARRAPTLLALAALATSALMLRDHALYAEGGRFGPLRLALLAWFPLLAVGAAVLLRDAARASPERALPRVLVAGALLVYPIGTLVAVASPAFWTGSVPGLPPMLVDGARWPQAVVSIASLAAVLAAPLLAMWAVVVATRAAGGWRVGALLALALASLVVTDLVPGGASARWPGATSLTFALLAAYALARGKLFDIDLRLKGTLSRGSVVGGIVGAGVLVAEVVAQQLVSDALGAAAGFVAAGVLVLVFRPLKRGADRLADRLMPGVRASPEYVERRKREVYLAALEGALADGLVTDQERRVLRRLGEKLGLDESEMDALEIGAPRR